MEGHRTLSQVCFQAAFLLLAKARTDAELGLCSVVVDGETLKDAVWHYPETKKAADHIKGHFAFWKGVKASPGHAWDCRTWCIVALKLSMLWCRSAQAEDLTGCRQGPCMTASMRWPAHGEITVSWASHAHV